MVDQTLITTSNHLEGYRITKHLGLVRGITVRSRNIFGSIGAAFQTLVYSICLIPLAIMPIVFGFTGIVATVLMVVTGILFTLQAFRLFNNCDLKSAQRLMFGSFIYLPVVQIIWMLNKIL